MSTAQRHTDQRVVLSWSSGKDSAWALQTLRQSPGIEVAGLLTTYNAEFDRVAMHAVRMDLVRAQAEAIGLPLLAVPLPYPCSNAQYESAMQSALAEARRRFSPTHIAFGDLWLEDVRRYREERMSEAGLEPLFPLWGMPTRQLAAKMVASGLRACVTCIDPRKLNRDFVGRTFDREFLRDLPADIDPCAEQGEFHTFVFDGPMFAHALSVTVGQVVERDGFVFRDLVAAAAGAG